jgi:hypothetical protein
MVLDTLPPRKMAPDVSMTTAMAMAHFSFRVWEPTDVAKALATSAIIEADQKRRGRLHAAIVGRHQTG